MAIGQRQPAQIIDRLALGLGPADSVTQAQVHAQLHTQVQTQSQAQAAPPDGVQTAAEGLKPSLGR